MRSLLLTVVAILVRLCVPASGGGEPVLAEAQAAAAVRAFEGDPDLQLSPPHFFTTRVEGPAYVTQRVDLPERRWEVSALTGQVIRLWYSRPDTSEPPNPPALPHEYFVQAALDYVARYCPQFLQRPLRLSVHAGQLFAVGLVQIIPSNGASTPNGVFGVHGSGNGSLDHGRHPR